MIRNEIGLICRLSKINMTKCITRGMIKQVIFNVNELDILIKNNENTF